MACDYTIRHEDPVIRVKVTGSWDYLVIDRMWHDIVAACEKHGCFDILGVSNTHEWDETAAYDHASIFAAAGVDARHRIAWVQEHAAGKELMKLAEAVVRNRVMASARVFDSVAEAKGWLTERSGSGT